jgi:hypothetical protein
MVGCDGSTENGNVISVRLGKNHMLRVDCLQHAMSNKTAVKHCEDGCLRCGKRLLINTVKMTVCGAEKDC